MTASANADDLADSAPREALHLCRRHIQGVLIFSAVINVLFLAPTLYMLQVYDRVLSSGSQPTLIFLTVALIIALGLLSLLDQLRQRILMAASVRLDRVFSTRMVYKLASRTAGEARVSLVQALREFDSVRAVITGPAALALVDLPWLAIYVLISFMVHWTIGVLCVAGAALTLGLAVINERLARDFNATAAQANGEVLRLQTAVSGASEVVRALGMSEALVVQFAFARAKATLPQLRGQDVQARVGGLIRFIRLLLQSAALGLGAWLALSKAISPGAIFAASMLVGRALGPIDLLVGQWRPLQAGLTGYRSIKALLTAPTAEPPTELPAPLPRLNVDQLSVASPDRRRLVLESVSFGAEGPCVVGVIGPSGSGKSTLLQALANARAPDQGEIRLGGARLQDWGGDSLGARVGYVPQACDLFPGTIKDNISRFQRLKGLDPEVDRKAIEAAREVGAHEFILATPQGYDTVIGPGGAGLSAGQTQMIALARAFYGAPDYFVLDEPNASLDGPSELHLMQAISRLKQRGALVVFSAHRMPLLSLADRLAVIRAGRLTHFGPSAEVLARLRPSSAQAAEPAPLRLTPVRYDVAAA